MGLSFDGCDRIPLSPTEIADFWQRWQIRELALFGSVLRDDFRPDSEIYVLFVFNSDFVRSPFHRLESQSALANLLAYIPQVDHHSQSLCRAK